MATARTPDAAGGAWPVQGAWPEGAEVSALGLPEADAETAAARKDLKPFGGGELVSGRPRFCFRPFHVPPGRVLWWNLARGLVRDGVSPLPQAPGPFLGPACKARALRSWVGKVGFPPLQCLCRVNPSLSGTLSPPQTQI